VIADYHGPVGDPAALAARFAATPGIVGHGLFPPEMVATVLVAAANRSAGPTSSAPCPDRLARPCGGIRASGRRAVGHHR
jgi:hypothetical protein